jgi:hypothetical protein
MGNAIVILGGGGPKKTRAYQDDPKLNSEANLLMEVSNVISEEMKANNLRFSDDELELEGNIILTT